MHIPAKSLKSISHKETKKPSEQQVFLNASLLTW